MAQGSNYDSSGINSGMVLGDIFSGLEQSYIGRRTKFFKQAKKGNFRTNALIQYQNYVDEIRQDGIATLAKAHDVVQEEISKSYQVGIDTIDRTIAHYEKQGANVPKQPAKIQESLLTGILAGVLIEIASVVNYSMNSAGNQYLNIVSQVNPYAQNIDQAIDDAQRIYLAKGIAGKQFSNGTEREMTSQAEFVLRQNSHNALIKAEGERLSEYGVQPLVQVSAHPSSCPLCSPWQDKILINDVFAGGLPDGRHELLSTALNAGLGHFNCRHNWIVFFEGLDKPDLFKHDKASPAETAERYAVEQAQRKNERYIREQKRIAEGSMSNVDREQALRNVEKGQKAQRELAAFAQNKGIPFYRQYSREQIDGATTPTIKPEVYSYRYGNQPYLVKNYSLSDGTANKNTDIKRDVDVIERNGYNVVVPLNLDKSKQRITVEQVDGAIERLPENMRRLVREVQLVDYNNPRDEYWSKKLGDDYRVAADAKGNRIVFYREERTMSSSDVEDLSAHEIAHLLDEVNRRPNSMRYTEAPTIWSEIRYAESKGKAGWISDYSKSMKSDTEDFADSIMLYLRDKNKFSIEHPIRAGEIRRMLNEK